MDAVDGALTRDILDLGRNMRTIEMGKQIAILEHDLANRIRLRRKSFRNPL